MARRPKLRWPKAEHALDPADPKHCVCGRAADGDEACPELMHAFARGEGYEAKAQLWYPLPTGEIVRENKPGSE